MAKIKDTWDNKYLRSEHFFPLGSIMKAYGDMHHGKPVPMEQFKKDAMELFELATQMGDLSYARGEEEPKGKDIEF